MTEEIQPRDLLVSSDVVLIFTNIQKEETLEIFKNQFKRTGCIMDLIEPRVKNTYFDIQGTTVQKNRRSTDGFTISNSGQPMHEGT